MSGSFGQKNTSIDVNPYERYEITRYKLSLHNGNKERREALDKGLTWCAYYTLVFCGACAFATDSMAASAIKLGLAG